jgi:hypothetical protein
MERRHHLQQNHNNSRDHVLLADCCQERDAKNKGTGLVVYNGIVNDTAVATTTATSDLDY